MKTWIVTMTRTVCIESETEEQARKEGVKLFAEKWSNDEVTVEEDKESAE